MPKGKITADYGKEILSQAAEMSDVEIADMLEYKNGLVKAEVSFKHIEQVVTMGRYIEQLLQVNNK